MSKFKRKKEEWINAIGVNIKQHRILETELLQRPDKNLAIAHANVYYFKQEMKFWLTPNENTGGYGIHRNVVGGFVNTMAGGDTTLKSDGKAIYKNSKMGELLIRNHSGKHNFTTPSGEQTVEIHNFTSYIPNHNNPSATDILVNIGASKPISYQSLDFMLAQLDNKRILELIERDNDELQFLKEKELSNQLATQENERKQELEFEKQELERQLKDLLEKTTSEYANSRSFIRKHAELRHQPILDKWQEEIKRSHLFKGAMAINGGPGTGKTTALIQRIKFLTDKTAMLGDSQVDTDDLNEQGYLPNMTRIQQEVLFSQNNWLFISPSELLKLFLKNSMIKEGLKADESRLWVWNDFKNLLIKKYNFINPETRNPFLILNKFKDEALFPVESKKLKRILDDFEFYFIQSISSSFEKTASLKTNTFSWHKDVLAIKNDLSRATEIKTIGELIRLFINLENNFSQGFTSLNKEYSSTLNDIALESLVHLKKGEKWGTIESNLSEWIKNKNNIQDEENEDEVEDEEEMVLNIDHFALQQIRLLIRKKALAQFDGKQSFSQNQNFLSEVLLEQFNYELHKNFKRLAELAFFSKYFFKYTRGLVSNVFSKLPSIYKSYRRIELNKSKSLWNREILEVMVNDQKEKNKRIHPNEKALLLYFANKLVNETRKISKPSFEKLNHPYVDAFKEIACPVIGIDEATDFHIIDLIAMESLKHPEISSVTYSGDLMQRLTQDGIRKWEELKPFIKNFKINELKISYRQSPTLLDVANKIYQKAIGRSANYESFADKDDLEPKPLLFENSDENEKAYWIAERIVEIYQAYGNMIPSIAVFLPSNADIKQFSENLGQLDVLCDIGINVVACEKGQILGDKNSVRVFSIDYVKGLEFEAAFFHNIDALYHNAKATKFKEELILKNIYVGLSRAAFYLGLTCSSVSSIKFIEDSFAQNDFDWHLKK